MKITLKYGERKTTIDVPDSARVEVLEPGRMPAVKRLGAALKQALAKPAGGDNPFRALLSKLAPKSVAIAVPDETRPAPLKQLLPLLLEEITRSLPHLALADISIVVGGGLHPPMDTRGISRILPMEAIAGCNLVAHDANQSPLVDCGTTSQGTKVLINQAVASADFKISIGQIDPHQFVGFTGGSKGITIGCAGADTIEHNHSLMFKDGAVVGRLQGNPVREDLNEAGELAGVDWAVNVVLDAEKQVVSILAGQPRKVLNEGAEICRRIYGVKLSQKFDIVVASCGGHPKDICLYQSQKGLNLASQAVKTGGRILLLAACPQGVGDDIYFDYVCQFATPQAVVEDFRNMEFTMGAHKAYLFGRTLSEYDVAVSSELDPGILGKCLLRAADPNTVITEWLEGYAESPHLAVVPNANTTYFYMA
jgi:nickel-dependent lactate racemase